MKSLIVLVAVAFVANAADDVCHPFHQCMHSHFEEFFNKFRPALKEFKEESEQCFNEQCPKPTHHEHVTHPPTPMPTDDIHQCRQQVHHHFSRCMKPVAAQAHHQMNATQHYGEPHCNESHHHTFHHDPRKVFQHVRHLCQNDTNAAHEFLKCKFEIANKTHALPALFVLSHPALMRCKVEAKCLGNLTEECQDKMDGHRAHFCKCRNDTRQFAHQNEHCEAAREAAKAKFEEMHAKFEKEHADAAKHHHGFQHFPHFDPCAEHPCEDYKTEVGKFKERLDEARAHHNAQKPAQDQ